MRTKVSGGRGNMKKNVNQVTRSSSKKIHESESDEEILKELTSGRRKFEPSQRVESTRRLKNKEKSEEIIDISDDSEADTSAEEVTNARFQKSMKKFDRDEEERDFLKEISEDEKKEQDLRFDEVHRGSSSKLSDHSKSLNEFRERQNWVDDG